MLLSAIKKKNISLEIHPAAQDAFDFYLAIEKLFHIEKLDTHAILFFEKSLILTAVEPVDSVLKIISGFEHCAFDLTKSDFSNLNIIIHKPTISDEDLSEIAWSCVIEKIFTSINQQKLGLFMDLVNEKTPEKIIKNLFLNKHLSELKLANLTIHSRACIAKQRQLIRSEKTELFDTENPKSISKESIFFEMSDEIQNQTNP